MQWAITFALLWFALIKLRYSPFLLLIFALFLSNPATLSFSTQDMGRFDGVNLTVLIVIAIVMIARASISMVAAVLFGVVGSVCILIHEGFFLIGVPLVLAMLLIDEPPRRAIPIAIGFSTPVLVTMAVVSLLAGPTSDRYELHKLVQNSADFDVFWYTTQVFYMTTSDSMKLTRAFSSDNFSVDSYARIVASILPGVVYAVLIWLTKLRSRSTSLTKLLILATVGGGGPLLLMLLGIDYGRWFSASALNIFLVMIWTTAKYGTEDIRFDGGNSVREIDVALIITGVTIVIYSIFAWRVPLQTCGSDCSFNAFYPLYFE